MAMAAKLALTDRAMTLDTDAMKAHQSHRRYFLCFCLIHSEYGLQAEEEMNMHEKLLFIWFSQEKSWISCNFFTFFFDLVDKLEKYS